VRRPAAAALLTLGWLAALACDSSQPVTHPVEAAAERGYAATVCGEVGSWLRTISASLKDFISGTSGRTTVAEERAAMTEHLDEVLAATQGLADDVRGASLLGEPGGGAFSGLLLESLRDVETAITEVREGVADPRGNSLDRYRREIGPLLERHMSRAVARTLDVLTPGSTGALTERFRAEPTCEGIFSPGSESLPLPS
jgi:hypothetical protein